MASKPGTYHPRFRNNRSIENIVLGKIAQDERKKYKKHSNKSFYRVKLKEVLADAEHTG